MLLDILPDGDHTQRMIAWKTLKQLSEFARRSIIRQRLALLPRTETP